MFTTRADVLWRGCAAVWTPRGVSALFCFRDLHHGLRVARTMGFLRFASFSQKILLGDDLVGTVTNKAHLILAVRELLGVCILSFRVVVA